jgi:hypothetical protein
MVQQHAVVLEIVDGSVLKVYQSGRIDVIFLKVDELRGRQDLLAQKWSEVDDLPAEVREQAPPGPHRPGHRAGGVLVQPPPDGGGHRCLPRPHRRLVVLVVGDGGQGVLARQRLGQVVVPRRPCEGEGERVDGGVAGLPVRVGAIVRQLQVGQEQSAHRRCLLCWSVGYGRRSASSTW